MHVTQNKDDALDKLRYFITGVIVLAVALVYVFLVKVQKPTLDMRISIEKDTFLYGEDFYVKYTLENLSDEVDSVLHFNSAFLSSAALIIDSRGGVNYGGDPTHLIPYPFKRWKYTKINPGEKLTELVKLHWWLGNFTRDPYGDYIFRGLCEKDSSNYIFSNTVAFHFVYPTGKDLEAFKEYRNVEDFANRKHTGAQPPEDRIYLTDKTIEVLYKYPKSVYAGKLLCMSYSYRFSYNYKFDESYLKDIEFFIENNPDSHYLNQLIGITDIVNGAFSETTLEGKEKAIAYLNSLKTKFKNEKLNELIDDDIARYQKLREK